MRRKVLRERIVLAAGGIVVSLLLIELLLLVFSALSSQPMPSVPVVNGKKQYRILAIGESTTANTMSGQSPWPYELEIILNNNSRETHFTVYNAGKIAADTDVILSDLEEDISRYKPHVVISMMGINDGPISQLKSARKVKSHLLPRTTRILSWSMRKMANWAWLTTRKSRALSFDGPYDHTIQYYQGLLDFSTAENTAISTRLLEEITLSSPDDAAAHLLLGKTYMHLGRLEDARDELVRSRALNDSCQSRILLADLSIISGDIDGADDYFGPGCEDYKDEMGEMEAKISVRLHDWQKAKAILMGRSVTDMESSMALGILYMMEGDKERSLEVMDALIRQDASYIEPVIMEAYLKDGTQDSKRILEDLKARPGFSDAFFSLEEKFQAYGLSFRDIEDFYVKSGAISRPAFGSQDMTRKNYALLRDRLNEEGIIYIAMQYPTLDVGIIEDMVDDESVHYVSNEGFKDILRNSSYDDYFIDSFGDTFGHTTTLGHRIIARNAAKTVWEVIEESGGNQGDVLPNQG